nr:DUF262 domain-containing protein [Thermotoga sp.]
MRKIAESREFKNRERPLILSLFKIHELAIQLLKYKEEIFEGSEGKIWRGESCFNSKRMVQSQEIQRPVLSAHHSKYCNRSDTIHHPESCWKTHTLGKLLEDIAIGEIGLPDIQRPFVWDTTRVRDLFDSMHRGYPIGTLLFWENGFPGEHRPIGTDTK